MDFTTTIIILVITWICYRMFWYSDPKQKKIEQEIRKIPGPRVIPILGTCHLVFFLQKYALFKKLDELTSRYGPIFSFWYGSIAEVNISDAVYIEDILRSSVNVKKGFFYDFLHPWLGNGLLTSTGQKWHSHRKLLTPTFHFKILEAFQEVFAEKSQVLVEKLEQELGNTKGFDVCPYITRCTLDIICETAMGTEINAQEDTRSPYVTAIHDISDLIVNRIFSPWLHPDFIYYLTNKGKRFRECLNILHTFSMKVIRERKQSRVKKVENKDEIYVPGKKKRMAFLDLLLDSSMGDASLSDEDIREEVDTFMFEGHDTTSTSLCWILFLLGTHSDVQEKVYEEQKSIFQDSDRLPNTQDLAEMKYLERVIKESLRLYPSVPFITRSLVEDIQLGEYTFSAGCQVTVHIYHAHRNPKYFLDPDTFNPDNFLPERVQERHPFAYIPFSAGSRNCIGQKFALLEEKTVLSSIVRRFRLTALDKVSDLRMTGDLILRAEQGIRLGLERR